MDIDWFFSSRLLPFSVALLLMFSLGVLELITLLMGMGLSSALEQWLPDLDIPDSGEISLPDQMLSWLNIGRVPLLMLLILFLFIFGATGLTLQALLTGAGLAAWHPALASLPAFTLALGGMHLGGNLISRLLPQAESESVSGYSFIGRSAVITIGEATRDTPAEARLTDLHGQAHYILVTPDRPGITFPAGTEIVILDRDGHIYRAASTLHHAALPGRK